MRRVKLAHLVILGLALGGAGPVLAQDPVAAQDLLKAPDAAPVPSAGEAQPRAQPQPEIQAQPTAPPPAPDPAAIAPPAPAPVQAEEQTPPPAPATIPAQTPPTSEVPPKIQDRAQIKGPTGAPPPAARRFSFDKVSDGFVRLDNESGQIAYCSPRTAGWSCEGVPEDRSALEREIERLRAEIAELRREIAAMVVPVVPPSPPPPASAPAPDDKVTLKLPTQDDLARAGAYVASTVQDTWRRLVEMIAGFQKDVMRKS